MKPVFSPRMVFCLLAAGSGICFYWALLVFFPDTPTLAAAGSNAGSFQSEQFPVGIGASSGDRREPCFHDHPITVEGLLASPLRGEAFLVRAVKLLAMEDPRLAVRLIAKLDPVADVLREDLIKALLESVPPENLAAVCGIAVEEHGSGSRRLLGRLAAEWAAHDFAAALEWAVARQDPASMGNVLAAVLAASEQPGSLEWNKALARLPSNLQDTAVMALVRKLPNEEGFLWLQSNCTEHDKWESWAIAALRRTGTPAAAFEASSKLGWLGANAELTNTLRGWQCWEDPGSFKADLAAETDPEKIRAMLRSGIQGLMNSDRAAGLELLRTSAAHFDHESLRLLSDKVTDWSAFGEIVTRAEGMDPSVKFAALCTLCDKTAQSSPADARSLVEQLASDPYLPSREDMTEYRSAIDGTMRHWVGSGAPGTEVVAWARSLPSGSAKDLSLEYAARTLVTRDNAAALSAAGSLTDPSLRVSNLALVAAAEPEWRAFAGELGISTEEARRIDDLAIHLRPLLESLKR